MHPKMERLRAYLRHGFRLASIESDRRAIEVRLVRPHARVCGVTVTFDRKDAARLLAATRVRR
ncbi:MAG TPA: hypothetical protein VM889_01845 [Candidatus Thermoplasmatota archaeon]|nr:hypothetical protein [Candidatus Thermoplasmatota archaeon]